MEKNQLIYKQYDKFYIVGTNKTISGNGIKNINYHGIVVIPKEFNQIPVKEIGQYAFSNCLYITHILIEAELKSLNRNCFSSMPSLQEINIPKTVEYIGYCALTSYNKLNESVSINQPNSMGTLVVSFEEGSQLKYIGSTPFGRKENIILLTTDDFSSIECNDTWYYSTNNFVIYSTKNFTSCDSTSVKIPFIDLYRDYESIKSILNSFPRSTNYCQTLQTFNYLALTFCNIYLI